MRFLLGLLAVAAFAENWPQFRGPAANGVSTGQGPVTWNGESGKNVQWKTPIPGLGYSSPVVWGDRIFVTSAVGKQGSASTKLGLYGDIDPVENEGPQSFEVFCLNRKTGRIIWTRTALTADPKVKRHPKSSHANPTPATDGRHLVVFFGSEGLYTYDMDGKLLWKKDLGTLDAGYFRAPAAQWGFASSPILYDGKVLIQADVQKDSFLAAFDVRDGRELWRTARADVPTFGSPAVADYTANGARTRQVVVNGWKQIAGYDLATGKELWHMAGGGDIPIPTPVSAGGLVIITNAHGGGRPVYAIRTDAAGDITGKAAIAWTADRSGNYMQTPLLDNGLGYFCYDNGVLTVMQLNNGERIYQQRLGTGRTGFTSSPVAAGGHLYITDEDGHTRVLALGREFRVEAENDLGEPVMASPAIAGGVLYLRGRQHLFAIAER